MAENAAIEAMARAIVGKRQFDALPERSTYHQRKINSTARWHDKEEARDDARVTIEILEEQGYSLVKRP